MKKIFWLTGELLILTVGLYYGNSARNARVQFEERRFLFYAITAELTFSSIHNAIRAVYPIPFHQDVTFIAAFLRSLLTNTLALFIIFAPKVCSKYTNIFYILYISYKYLVIIIFFFSSVKRECKKCILHSLSS